MISLKEYIIHFLEYLEIERGRAHTTIKGYDFYLHRFISWLDLHDVKKPHEITQEHVRQYRLWLNRLTDRFGESLKKNTQNYHLIAVRAFLKYLAKRDVTVIAPEKIELAKMPQRQVDFLEGSDLERLLDSPLQKKVKSSDKETQENDTSEKKEGHSIIALRDKALLEVLFSTGLRVSEVASLKIDSINLDKEEFTVRGKGSKLRLVFLSEQSRYWLKKYLARRRDMNPSLFISHDRAADKRVSEDLYGLTPRSIQRIIEGYTRQAGITKRVTPHTMRHSYATDLLLNGADIRSVQSLLGHESITTTQVYTHITNQQLRQVHKKFHNKNKKSE